MSHTLPVMNTDLMPISRTLQHAKRARTRAQIICNRISGRRAVGPSTDGSSAWRHPVTRDPSGDWAA
jgi:hypothetical protein